MQVKTVLVDAETALLSAADEPLVIGPLILARASSAAVAAGPGPRRGAAESEFIVLYFPNARSGSKGSEVLLSDGKALAAEWDPQFHLALLAPRRYLAGVLPAGAQWGRMPRSAGLRILQRYLDGLLALDRDRLCEAQKALAANAVRSLLVAAFAQAEPAAGGLKDRRRDALIGRVNAYVDAHLLEDLTVDALCSGVGCSRSVLYRAAEEAGGVSELVLRRRLMAAHDRLQDGDESRSIVAIADAYRFPDVVQFNRRFKALFGVPPGQIRLRKNRVEPTVVPPSRAREAPRQRARRHACR